MTDQPLIYQFCGIVEETRNGWEYKCLQPKGHPRVSDWQKHLFEWVPTVHADPAGPGPEPGTEPLPRRTPGATQPAVPLNPRNDPNVEGLPRRGSQEPPAVPPRHPFAPGADPLYPRAQGPIPTTTEMEEEERRRARERDTRDIPNVIPRTGDTGTSGPVPGSRVDTERWRRAVDEGAFTGPRGIDDTDEPEHDVEEVQERRGRGPGVNPIQPRIKPGPPTTGGGSTMSSVADVKAALNAANSMVTEGQELLHAAQQKLDDAMSAYMAALDSASQDTIYNIGGPLDAMKEHVADALQSGETVKEASQTYANAL